MTVNHQCLYNSQSSVFSTLVAAPLQSASRTMLPLLRLTARPCFKESWYVCIQKYSGYTALAGQTLLFLVHAAYTGAVLSVILQNHNNSWYQKDDQGISYSSKHKCMDANKISETTHQSFLHATALRRTPRFGSSRAGTSPRTTDGRMGFNCNARINQPNIIGLCDQII